MAVDIIILAIVFLMAVFGYRKGFLCQIFGLAGIAAVVFLAGPAAEIVENVLRNEFSVVLPGRHMGMLLISACGAVIYIIVYLIGSFIRGTLVRGIKPAEKTDSVLGMVTGIAEAAIVIYVVLGIFAIGMGKVSEYAPKAGEVISESSAYQIVAQNNLIEHSDYLTRLFVVKKDSEKSDGIREKAADHGKMQEDISVRRAVPDPSDKKTAGDRKNAENSVKDVRRDDGRDHAAGGEKAHDEK